MLDEDYPFEGRAFGDYYLERGVGRGGTADVYLAMHTVLKRYAAVKVLHVCSLSQPEDVAAFEEEARTLAKLEHRHIIDIYHFGVEAGIPYIVMRYAPESMRQRHPRGSVLQPEIVVGYVRQIAEALQYAHDRGLVHRDIKPENLLFDSSGTLRVSDFGIAVPTASRRIDRVDIIGTVAYMSPEQFGEEVDRQSDQYSLGIVVYEWLTGRLPFAVKTDAEAVQHHKHAPVPPMAGAGLSISLEVEEVVKKALAKDPQQRFETITHFAQALAKAVNVLIVA